MNIKAVTKTFEGKRVLDMPALQLEKGQRYALLGANGSGKSTYARLLACTLAPDSGESPLDKGLSVGYLPQKPYAFRMSAAANLALSGKDKSRGVKLAKALGIEGLLSQNAKKLSGGETARLALGRLLMSDCQLLILDEPTAAMDVESTLKAEELISDYCRQTGCTLLLITHSLQQARRMTGEAFFLHKGSLAEKGQTELLLSSPLVQTTQEFVHFSGIMPNKL